MTYDDLRKIISDKAAAGHISLSDIEDGDDFDSVSEWLEYAGAADLEAVAEKAIAINATPFGEISERDYDARRGLAKTKGMI